MMFYYKISHVQCPDCSIQFFSLHLSTSMVYAYVTHDLKSRQAHVQGNIIQGEGSHSLKTELETKGKTLSDYSNFFKLM